MKTLLEERIEDTENKLITTKATVQELVDTLTIAKRELEQRNKPKLKHEMKELIAHAVEEALRNTDFCDIDGYDASFTLDYDGRVVLDDIDWNQADSLAEEIADSIEFLFNFDDNE